MATLDSIAGYLLKDINRAVHEFDLIEEGDRIAVGVSGGKDSRALLELLLRGVDIPGSYTVVAIHIDGSATGLPDLRPVLELWFDSLGVESACVPMETTPTEKLPMSCYRCAWNRRRTLFHAADQLGCNKVALGHHADDAAATTLMSLMYKGRVETLEPRRSYFGDRLTLIRPLLYVTGAEIARYARASGWTFPPEQECPRREQSQRSQIDQFLSRFSTRERKQIRANLWRAARDAGMSSPSP